MRKWWRRHRKARNDEERSEVQSLIDGISTLYEARPRLLAELRRARRHERPLTLLSLTPEGKSERRTKGAGRRHSNGNGNGAGRSNGTHRTPDRGHSNGNRNEGGRPHRTHGHEQAESNGNSKGIFPGWNRNEGGISSSSSGAVLHFDLLFVGILLRNMLREADLVALSLEEPGYAVLLPETKEVEGRATAARLNRIICDRTSLTIRIGAAAFPQDGFTIEDLLGRARYGERHPPEDPVKPGPESPREPLREPVGEARREASREARRE